MSVTAFKQVADNAISTTATSLTSTGVTSITLNTGDGNLYFPAIAPFRIDLWSGSNTASPTSDPNYERVTCTARSGDTLTISATTKTHTGPTNVMLPNAASDIGDLQTAVNNLEVKRTYVTVGKAGSNADFVGDGVNDHVAIQNAINFAATSPNVDTVFITGYGYDYEYQIGGTITIKSKGSGGNSINISGYGAILQHKSGFSGDTFITNNFYSEINTNYNSYSQIGNGYIEGIGIEGNSGGGTIHTITYASMSAFPATGVAGNIYVDRSTDTGYYYSGGAYTTSGIADSGHHWRAYAYHAIKIYGYHMVLRDVYIHDCLEFGLYSEQTNTDTNTFNDYSTMESTLEHVNIVGWSLGGINWLGPHDSLWSDVKLHTNEYATNSLYNVYSSQGANWNGGAMSWFDVHPWGPTASYGANVVLVNSSIRGSAYIEGSSNIGLQATNSTISMNLVVTNSNINVQLTNCYNTRLDIDNYYQYTTTGTLVQLIGSITGSQIRVNNVDISNINSSSKVFDVTGVTSSANTLLYARIPYSSPAISAGVTNTSLDLSSEIDVVTMGSTPALATIVRKFAAYGTPTPGYVVTADANGNPKWGSVSSGSGTTWQVITASQTASIQNGYITNGSSLVTVTLPATAAVGNTVTITGLGAGGWSVAQQSGVSINFGATNTTTGTGGSLASTNIHDSVHLLCVVANTTWQVINSVGNITVV